MKWRCDHILEEHTIHDELTNTTPIKVLKAKPEYTFQKILCTITELGYSVKQEIKPIQASVFYIENIGFFFNNLLDGFLDIGAWKSMSWTAIRCYG